MIKSGRKITRKDDELIAKINKEYIGDIVVPYRGNVGLASSKSQFKYDKDRVEVIRKSAQNILYFAQHFFYIINLDEGKQKINLHTYQRDVLRLLRDNKKVVVNASRQIGKTTIATIYALWLVTFFEYKKIVIVANKEKTAQEIFSRIKMAYEELPNWIKPAPVDGHYAKQGFKLSNGSEISISATSNDAIRGVSANCILLDEAAHIDPGILDEFWSAVFPVISSGKKTRVIITSTPNGTGNLFHKIFSEAKEGKNGWAWQEIPYTEVPDRDEAWAEEQKLTLGDDLFEQEFNCKFLQSGQSLIPEETYNRLLKNVRDPMFVFEGGNLKIWDQPKLDERIYCAGIDVGEGDGACASVLQILDITDLTDIKQAAQYHSNDEHPSVFSKKSYDLLRAFGNPPLAIERNNTGGGIVLKSFEDFNYPNLVTFAMKQGQKKVGHIRGVTSQTNTKYAGVQNFFYWIKKKEILNIRDIETLKEVRTFVRHKNNRYARRGADVFDDRVDSLIWALIVLVDDVVDDFYAVLDRDENKKPSLITPLYKINMDKDTPYDYMFNSDSKFNVLNGVYGGNSENKSEIDILESEGWMNPYAFSKTKSYQTPDEFLQDMRNSHNNYTIGGMY